MGRIAEAAEVDIDERAIWSNKVDVVLDELDDDEDRAVVLSWLRSDMGAPKVKRKLAAYGILVSDRSVQYWRAAQRDGVGRLWGA